MKLDEIDNKSRTEKLLNEYFDINGNYSIDENNEIHVEGNCSAKKQTRNIMNIIPIKFQSVSGHFIINDVPISSLHNAPIEVGGMFLVNKTFLDNLEEMEKIRVTGPISFNNNHITSIKGMQKMVYNSFSCNQNPLTSLEGGPERVKTDFSIFKCNVSSLIGGPTEIGDNFDCRDNPITNLKGLPRFIGGTLWLTYDRELPLLDIMFVKGLQSVKLWPEYPTRDYIKEVEGILNKYINKGAGGAIQCAAELTKAGYKGNARR